MKAKCPICGKGKAQRSCMRHDKNGICSQCCAKERDASCSCVHYTKAATLSAEAQHRRASRQQRASQDDNFIMEFDPETQEQVNKALELAHDGKVDEAWDAMEKLQHRHPLNHVVCFGMGTLCAMKEEHRKAIEWFEKATRANPYFIEAHYNKAVAYKMELDLSNCVRSFEAVIKYGDPEESEVENARNSIKEIAEVILKAEGVDLQTYIQAQDEFSYAFDFMRKGEWANALAGFQQCLAKTPRNAPTHGNIGICLMQLGRKAEAIASLNKALEINPSYEPAVQNKAICDRMKEGVPPSDARFAEVNYSLDRVRQEKEAKPSGSIFNRVMNIFKKN